MKVELPEFTRCCFCLPLRYGLITWGYIKLIVTLLFISSLIYFTVLYIVTFKGAPGYVMSDLVTIGIIIILFSADVCMTIVFLVGGHKKTAKLLEVFKVYSIVLLCIFTTLFVLSITLGLYVAGQHGYNTPHFYISHGFMVHTKIVTGLVNIGIQVYIILLIRSEINKLRNNCKFRFTNIANEAECAMENEITEQLHATIDHKVGIDDLKKGSDDVKIATDDHDDETDADFERTAPETINYNFNYNKF